MAQLSGAEIANNQDAVREIRKAVLEETYKTILKPSPKPLKSFIEGLIMIFVIFLLLKINGAFLTVIQVSELHFISSYFQIFLWWSLIVSLVVTPFKLIR